MIKYKQSKDNKEPISGVILAYGYTDYCEEQVFIVDTNPIVLVKNDHTQLIEPIEFIGEEVEYLPIEINESENLVICSLNEAEIITGKNALDRDRVVVNSAVVTDMFEWGCFVAVNGQYTGKLMNKNYFVNLVEGSEGSFRGGRLMSVFSVGDEIPNLECVQNKNKTILDLYLTEKVDMSSVEEYPLSSVSEIQGEMVVECAVREVFPNCCYVKIAPKVDALCGIPEYLDLDRDLMPEDIVRVRIKSYRTGVRGKILDVLKLSNFRYEEMDGEFIC